MTPERPMDVMKRYMNAVIAFQKDCEIQLCRFAKEASRPELRQLFAGYAEQTKGHCGKLTARLEAMGGSTSILKDLLTHLFPATPIPAEWGRKEQENDVRDLIAVFALESSGIAVCEALAAAACAAGDTETEQLVRVIQNDAHEAAGSVWNLIASSARLAFLKCTCYSEHEVA